MKRILMMEVAAMMATVMIHAQIDPQVIEVLKKSQEKMSNPHGTEIEMTIDVTLMVKLTGIKITSSEKGNKLRVNMESKVLGQELMAETGFDGQQEWQYIHHKNDDERDYKTRRDTLTIIKTALKPTAEHAVDYDIYKNYKTGKIRLNGKYYEITLSKPVKKEAPSKVVMKIDKDKYYFREMKTKIHGATMTMRMTKIKFGVSDDVFKLDLKKYPNAVVVRK